MASKKSVAVDVDGVLARYNGWKGVREIGKPIDGAREFLAKLQEKWRVIIHSTRLSESVNSDYDRWELAGYVAGWLMGHDLPFDEVWTEGGKPKAVAYVDDRGVSCRPQDYKDPRQAFSEALIQVALLA
jgi:hypothetical protein